MMLHLHRQGAATPEEAETLFAQFQGKEIEPPPDRSPQEDARILAYDAVEQDGGDRVRLAKQALALDQECIDAWLALWDLAFPDQAEALTLAERAHDLARAKLTEVPEDFAGDDLWQCGLDFRPTIRAHAALALTLWARGERARALRLAEETVTLNPADNTGMRWRMANWYLTERQRDKAVRLLRAYPDDPVAPMQYAVALAEFARSGESKKAQRRLRAAVEANPVTLCFLTCDAEAMKPPHIELFAPGGLTEALVWHHVVTEAWQAVPGAMDWLQRCTRQRWFVSRMAAATVQMLAERAERTEDGPAEAGPGPRELNAAPDQDAF